METFWIDYGLFAAKTLTVVVAIALILGRIFALAARNRLPTSDRIAVTRLNRKFKRMAQVMQREMLPEAALKLALKADKAEAKARKAGTEARRRMYVLDFHGDVRASAVASLREEITAVLQVAQPGEEVVLRLESGGGLVHAYGLAASQLQRLRKRGLKLTVAVDKVAASGGYMMAAVADRVVAAPFAIVGSIGVVAQVPNLHRLLKRHDVDLEMMTAGEWKRTLTIFGENTDKGRAKFQAEIDDTHALFKEFLHEQRPALDVDLVATGEHWFGARSVALGLVDELATSDDYLLAAATGADLYEVHFTPKRPLSARLSAFVAATVDRVAMTLWERAEARRLP